MAPQRPPAMAAVRPQANTRTGPTHFSGRNVFADMESRRSPDAARQARHHGDARQQRHQGNGCNRQSFFPTREDAPDARHLVLPLTLAAPELLELFVEPLPVALVPSAFARGLAGCWTRYSFRSRCTSSNRSA